VLPKINKSCTIHQPTPYMGLVGGGLMDGTALIDFGKHSGRTYADVEASEPSYCAWVQGLVNPNGSLQAFADYLSARSVQDLEKKSDSDSDSDSESEFESRSSPDQATHEQQQQLLGPQHFKEITLTVEILSSEKFKVSPGGFIDRRVWSAVNGFCSSAWCREQKAWVYPAKAFAEIIGKLKENSTFTCTLDLPPQWVLKHFKHFQIDCDGEAQVDEVNERDKQAVVKLSGKLMKYQQDAINFAIARAGRCLLGDEMGLGKTIQALGIVAHYREEWPCLVLVPSSMRYIWQDMICEWLEGVERHHVQVIRSGKDEVKICNLFTVVTYDLVQKHEKFQRRSKDGKPYEIILVDESHYIKDVKSKRSKAAVTLCKAARRSILLSGTPALNRACELYPQMLALMPDKFPDFTSFCQRYCVEKISKFNGHKIKTWADSKCKMELNNLLMRTVMIRRLKKDVLEELPDKTRQRITFHPSQLEKAALEGMESVRLQSKEPLQEEADMAGAGIPELFKLAAESKVKPVLEHLETIVMSGVKFLCFCHHHLMLDACAQRFTELNVQFVRIDGKTPQLQRHESVSKFQSDGGPQVALLSITACAQGLTLTAAHLVVFAELYWVPGIMLQAEDRVHRVGQKSACLIQYLMAAGTLDERMYSLLIKKSKDLTRILDGVEHGMDASEKAMPCGPKRSSPNDHGTVDIKRAKICDQNAASPDASSSHARMIDASTHVQAESAKARSVAPIPATPRVSTGRGRPKGSTKAAVVQAQVSTPSSKSTSMCRTQETPIHETTGARRGRGRPKGSTKK